MMLHITPTRRILGFIKRTLLLAFSIPMKFSVTTMTSFNWRGIDQFILRSLTSLPANSKVLNVGAGGKVASSIDRVAEIHRLQVHSIDIDPARHPDEVADIITYANHEKYDAILIIEVLEHVTSPTAAVDNMFTLLRPGGVVFCSTPFLFPEHDRPHDYHRFTRFGLELLFRRYEIDECCARIEWAESMLAIMTRIVRDSSKRALLISPIVCALAWFLWPLAALVQRLIPFEGLTLGYTTVASKPVTKP